MKVKELKIMNELGLDNKLVELKKELMKINSQIAIGTVPKSPGKVKEIKRAIAKILTIKNQKGGIKKV
ncbi:MAG: 50S ribosomal protein L29 [Candidatus Woesearchaeota archaeon]|jgi:large subunit ribosomal protein L29|nr:50S ribosomal protein L29 [Candidatus Woesearchaeota archaeon]|tara:strand:- start:12610 stop:12813 length:204 start_codon:yes stop_codon:yes gene_type:complete